MSIQNPETVEYPTVNNQVHKSVQVALHMVFALQFSFLGTK